MSRRTKTWMPFNTEDYMADTVHLSVEEHGAFMLLLMRYWQSGPLQDDPETLAMVARCVELGSWERISGTVMGMFDKTAAGFVSRHVEQWNYKTYGRLPQAEWRILKREVLERDSYICSYCRSAASECDHITPLIRGGTNDPDNLTAACMTCNRSKGGKLLEEWRP